MRLAVNPKNCTVSVYHSDTVVGVVDITLKKADRNNNAKLPANRPETPDCKVLIKCFCKLVVIVVTLLTEILCFKQLRKKYDVCTLSGGISYKVSPIEHMILYLAAHSHLNGCHPDLPHFCLSSCSEFVCIRYLLCYAVYVAAAYQYVTGINAYDASCREKRLKNAYRLTVIFVTELRHDDMTV